MVDRLFPNPAYATHVLAPSFAEAKERFFAPMIAANKAHVLMLLKQGIINQECAQALLAALLQIEAEGPEAMDYQPGVEDLYFCVERRLIALAGAEAGGNLQLARSRNDLGVALGRLLLRDRLLGTLERLNHFRATLLAFGRQHLETIMPGYTHTQPAQPTTLAHYLAGVLSFMERDATRLKAAYATTNCSPLGAAAFTTSGFPVDRRYVAELLGFAGPMESSYDAIGASDHMTEAVAALLTMAANLSRFIRDLLFWATREAGAIRIGDDFVQISSIMPQKRNPVVLEHLRARLGRIYGHALSVLTMSHNVPYGDTQDIEDEICEPLFGAFEATDAVLELYAAVFESLEVNHAHLLARSAEGFTTATELADTLVREKGLAFRTAHAIVARLVEMATAQGLSPEQVGVAMLEGVALTVTGRPLGLTEEALRRALDPVHFVQVRRVMGGPAPEATAAVLANVEAALERDRSWLDGEKEELALARAVLIKRVESIVGGRTKMTSESPGVKTLTVEQLAKTIDHSLLKPELTEQDVIEGCRLARQYHVASVCVRPCDVPLAVSEMKGSDVKVGTVVGFPHGNHATATKAFEARQAVADGAQELDMVINIGALRSGRYDYVENDIRAVVEAAGEGVIVKVILENCYLTDEEKVKACQLAEAAGADFVKTSTGFAASGATLEDLRLMRASVGPQVQIKATHGVRSLEAALQVIEAGATRFGATRTKKILDDFKRYREEKEG